MSRVIQNLFRSFQKTLLNFSNFQEHKKINFFYIPCCACPFLILDLNVSYIDGHSLFLEATILLKIPLFKTI
jgi:hypothetical protein